MQDRNFESILRANANKNIGMYLTQNHFVEGIILDVQRNHIALEVENNIVYISIHQILALSKSTKDLRIAKKSFKHLVRKNLADVLMDLRYHWVTINRFSNHTFLGVLGNTFEDHIALINNSELFHIPISQITDISEECFLISEEERIKVRDIDILADLTDLINKVKNSPDTVSSLLIEQANTLGREQEVGANEGDVLTDLTEIIDTGALEGKHSLSPLEEKLEALNVGLVGTVANEDKLFTKDDNSMEVTEIIHEDALADETNSLQSKKKLDFYPVELENPTEEKGNEYSTEQHNIPDNHRDRKGKDVLLTAWSTMNSDQSTVALPKKNDSKRNSVTPIENTVTSTLTTGLNEQTTQLEDKTNWQDKRNIFDEVSEKTEKKKPLIIASVRSKKEIEEMLEQQYFALMNYAAVQISNEINFKQANNKLHFHPRIEGNIENPRRCEIISNYHAYDSKYDTASLEKQYISLMRHATTMYRKLRK